MKRLFLILLIGYFFTGCYKEECRPDIQIEYRTQEVVKYKKCDYTEVNCDFAGDGFVPTQKLLACVIEQKRVIEVCK